MATTAATARTLPTPPSVPSFPLTSKSKKRSTPNLNSHPYAIKTTSSGLLTRSNTSTDNVNAVRHYYIPSSPNSSRLDYTKGHRTSKSLTDSPSCDSRPLPTPPLLDTPASGISGGYVSADEVSAPPRRPRRSETLPIIPISSPALPAPSVDDLPDNPKLWTPSQLATYLTAALRMTSTGKPGETEAIGLSVLVAKDIASFVKSARIGGRTFLRLNDEDLEVLGMNKKWRDALLTSARNLRQNVLKDRIWGADGSTSPPPQPASPPKIFANMQFNSSSSSIGSSASVSAGEDDGLTGTVLGRSKARRYRGGRVRGMVETFERSGSFSSDGGFEDGEDSLAAERANLRRWARQEGQVTGERVVESPSPSRRRPLPVPPSPNGSVTMVADEEPTVEELLAELTKSPPTTGARAWEEMDLAPGITVKHLPPGADVSTMSDTLTGAKTVSSLGSGRSSSGRSKAKGERRVVTAIFAPGSVETASDAPQPSEAYHELELLVVSQPAPALNGFADKQQPKSRPLPPTPGQASTEVTSEEPAPELVEAVEFMPDSLHLERLLEEEILTTRALLNIFRARLEIVEQKVADLEGREEEVLCVAELDRASASASTRSAVRPQTHTQTQTELEERGSVEIGVQAEGVRPAVAVVDAEIQSEAAVEEAEELESGAGMGAGAVPQSGARGKDKGKYKASASSSGLIPSAALHAIIPDVMRGLHAPVALFSSSSSGSGSSVRNRGDEDGEPANLSDLPSYVFLVGLGVCAVVMRVVLKKVVGKGGFRP